MNTTAPRRAAGSAKGEWTRRLCSMQRMASAMVRLTNSPSRTRKSHRRLRTESTHWRTDTDGMTALTRWAAVKRMQLTVQDGLTQSRTSVQQQLPSGTDRKWPPGDADGFHIRRLTESAAAAGYARCREVCGMVFMPPSGKAASPETLPAGYLAHRPAVAVAAQTRKQKPASREVRLGHGRI